jgi:hypothetical protein
MLGENKATDALGAKVAAVPVVRATDLGTLQDPDNQGRTLEL